MSNHVDVQELLKCIFNGTNDFNINSGFMVDFGEETMKKIAKEIGLSLTEENKKFLKFERKEDEKRMFITFDIKSKAVILAASQGGRY